MYLIWNKNEWWMCGGERKKRELVMLPTSSKEILFPLWILSVPRIRNWTKYWTHLSRWRVISLTLQTINNLLLRAKTHMHGEKAGILYMNTHAYSFSYSHLSVVSEDSLTIWIAILKNIIFLKKSNFSHYCLSFTQQFKRSQPSFVYWAGGPLLCDDI